jgi:hypothetical protein
MPFQRPRRRPRILASPCAWVVERIESAKSVDNCLDLASDVATLASDAVSDAVNEAFLLSKPAFVAVKELLLLRSKSTCVVKLDTKLSKLGSKLAT